MGWVKILKKKINFFLFFLWKEKKKTLSLDNGRKKKLNPLFTNNKLQLPFSFLVHVSWFFLCIFFTYKGYANSFQISSGSFHFKTLFSCPTAIENSGTFSNSTFVSNELISTNNSPLSNNKLFFFLFFFMVVTSRLH